MVRVDRPGASALGFLLAGTDDESATALREPHLVTRCDLLQLIV
jgi:hypothetical protein